MHNVILPKYGLTMEEGTLAQWFVKVGDSVQEGDPLCEVETDKLVNTINAKEGGVVKEILVAEDETVPVLSVLAVIE